MSNKLKAKFLLFLTSLSFVTPLFASADIGQTAISNTSTPNSTALGTSTHGDHKQKLGTGLAGTVATTTIYLSDTGGLGAITPSVRILCYDDAGYTSLNAGCSGTAVSSAAENGAAKHLVEFSTPLTFTPTKYYALGIGCSAGCSGGTNPNLITYGTTSNLYPNGDFTTAFNITDLYFNMEGADISTAPTISFDLPTDGGTFADFDYWKVDVTGMRSEYYLKIIYTPSGGGGSGYTDTVQYSISGEAVDSFLVPKSQRLWYPPYTLDVGWTAGAYVLDSDGTTVLALSGDIGFIINGAKDITYLPSSTTPYATVSSTAAFAYDNIDCTIDTGWVGVPTAKGWECIFRKAGSWLFQLIFVPSQISTNFLSDTYDDFKTVFPFAIFFKVTNTLSSAAGDSSLAPAQSIIYTFESPRLISVSGSVLISSSTDDITFASSTTLSGIIGSPLQIILFNGILLIFIIGAIFIIYRIFVHH